MYGLSEKYAYHGVDITLDVYDRIKDLVELIAKKENIPFEDAYILLADSKLYTGLQNMETLYWSESPEFLLEEFYRLKTEEC
ncbi:MAG: hypothetical protein Q4A04_01090 [Eubacteriales bacterium]|nr:hypothetical protein [Eubacteriales bacterium]